MWMHCHSYSLIDKPVFELTPDMPTLSDSNRGLTVYRTGLMRNYKTLIQSGSMLMYVGAVVHRFHCTKLINTVCMGIER